MVTNGVSKSRLPCSPPRCSRRGSSCRTRRQVPAHNRDLRAALPTVAGLDRRSDRRVHGARGHGVDRPLPGCHPSPPMAFASAIACLIFAVWTRREGGAGERRCRAIGNRDSRYRPRCPTLRALPGVRSVDTVRQRAGIAPGGYRRDPGGGADRRSRGANTAAAPERS